MRAPKGCAELRDLDDYDDTRAVSCKACEDLAFKIDLLEYTCELLQQKAECAARLAQTDPQHASGSTEYEEVHD